jgi:alpha-tubulin suppressor-like RCC1 family protein
MTDVVYGGELAQLAAEYEILGELGRGGSAVVYRAVDRGLGRDVAIKVVHPRPLSPDDDAVARLAREARTVAQLQHPNIVTVFAVRRLASGGLALVMQLVPGRTLKAIVQQDGPFSADRCQRVLRDVASALAYAHSRGVVHRDVKPENIFVDEQSSRALLSDFGIARSDDYESMTLTGTAIGTPFYMSPEQIEGTAVDGRSDLYSLGLVAWEMLTARRPWDGESLYNVIYKQKHEELPPIEALRSGVPPRLQYIIERMLQKDPRARWAGADGLLAQLSHSVLPGDYARWQAALRKRVERYHASERERAASEQPVDSSGGLLSSTIRFVRNARSVVGGRVTGGRGTARSEGAAPGGAPALANTMVVPRGGVEETEPGGVATLAPPAPAGSSEFMPAVGRVADVAVAPPTWARPSSGRHVAWGVGAALAAVVIVGGAAFALRGGGIAQLTPLGRRVQGWFGTRALTTAQPEHAPPSASVTARPRVDGTRGVLDGPIATDGALGTAAVSANPVPHSVLALGGRHTCAVTIDGSVQCWGANERGQLGDGSARRQVAPVRVAAELSFASVGAGLSQTCGVTRTGDVYCWGNDASGQLGDATTVRRTAPVRIAGAGVYRSVSGGDAHSCGLTFEGSVHCWGSNAHGQLGDGSTQPHLVPTAVSPPPGERLVQVVTGSAHTCALTARGRALCWGSNDRGQLGVGGGPDRNVPTLVAADVHFAAVAAGVQHTCGLATDGSVWCWGTNARGQLGAGSRTPSAVPQRVRLPGPATALATGGMHTCVLVPDGDAYCWGANGAGQLGIGSFSDETAPARVAAPEPLTALAAGWAHTCGVTPNGGLLCWGNNSDGQLGDATRIGHPVPVRVAFGESAPTRATETRPAP